MIQCCFVNTEQEPLEIKRLGMFKYGYHDSRLHVSELCEVFYPHPDAPEHAKVSVYRELEVSFPIGSDKLIAFTIDAVKALQSITELK